MKSETPVKASYDGIFDILTVEFPEKDNVEVNNYEASFKGMTFEWTENDEGRVLMFHIEHLTEALAALRD